MMNIDDEEEGQHAVAEPQVEIGSTWDVVGPFPSGMREHPFIASPIHAFPPRTFVDDPDVDFARRPYAPTETWPSELAEGGRVGWSKFKADKNGWLEVFYPDIRWDQLRSDRGWASLQYQVLLRTTITIPLQADHAETPVLIDVIQGTEYAFIPIHRPPQIPTKWFNGDVYDFASSRTGQAYSTGQTSNLARTVCLPPGQYTMIVRAHYETRLFGDPKSAPKPARGPVIRMKVQAVTGGRAAQAVQGLRVVPDVMDGWFMGDWISVGLRAGMEDVKVKSVSIQGRAGVRLGLSGGAILVRAGQTRSIALRVIQDEPMDQAIQKLEISLSITEGAQLQQQQELHWQVQLQQRYSNTPSGPCTITFASPSVPKYGSPASISYATLILPISLQDARTDGTLPPVILALHGAGVDASSVFWSDAIPKRRTGWAVLPTGRNEWGEDWHGGSMADAWRARETVSYIAYRMNCCVSTDTLLMGHSNGGQGAWHLAARYPDRVVGVIAASGWLTIHDYVPYIEQTANHFADPALMGILRSSLTPYDNDLHASNLVGIPILAIHGSDDDNVTPRHSRAHLAAIAAWAGNDNLLTLLEIPKKGHFWAEIFNQPKVIQWMDRLPHEDDSRVKRNKSFTLTCANPLECGGRAGVKILELEVPGRLARLRGLGMDEYTAHSRVMNPQTYQGLNVRKFSVSYDGKHWEYMKKNNGYEGHEVGVPARTHRAYGPMIRLLATEALFTIVYGNTPALRLLALRLAHDLMVYHRIDTEILNDSEGREKVAEGLIPGSLVCLGRPEENELVDWMAGEKKVPVAFPLCDAFEIDGNCIRGSGTGIITLHPHPCRPLALAAIIAGNDVIGTELAARLFPIRTGVTVPDWAIVLPTMRSQGAGGLVGAGFYGHNWKYNSVMSWLDTSACVETAQTCGPDRRKRPRQS